MHEKDYGYDPKGRGLTPSKWFLERVERVRRGEQLHNTVEGWKRLIGNCPVLKEIENRQKQEQRQRKPL